MSQLNQPQQAMLIWPVLALAPQMQRVLTYGELEGYTGIAAQGQHTALGLIHDYCKRKDYPILNAIVVSAKNGFPARFSTCAHAHHDSLMLVPSRRNESIRAYACFSLSFCF